MAPAPVAVCRAAILVELNELLTYLPTYGRCHRSRFSCQFISLCYHLAAVVIFCELLFTLLCIGGQTYKLSASQSKESQRSEYVTNCDSAIIGLLRVGLSGCVLALYGQSCVYWNLQICE